MMKHTEPYSLIFKFRIESLENKNEIKIYSPVQNMGPVQRLGISTIVEQSSYPQISRMKSCGWCHISQQDTIKLHHSPFININ